MQHTIGFDPATHELKDVLGQVAAVYGTTLADLGLFTAPEVDEPEEPASTGTVISYKQWTVNRTAKYLEQSSATAFRMLAFVAAHDVVTNDQACEFLGVPTLKGFLSGIVTATKRVHGLSEAGLPWEKNWQDGTAYYRMPLPLRLVFKKAFAEFEPNPMIEAEAWKLR